LGTLLGAFVTNFFEVGGRTDVVPETPLEALVTPFFDAGNRDDDLKTLPLTLVTDVLEVRSCGNEDISGIPSLEARVTAVFKIRSRDEGDDLGMPLVT
jgi:hypothetical protein